jgi:predicted amidohydrolase YtcJ
VLCFGSDTPVAPANPFAAIAAAVSARTLDGKVWVPEQSISRRDALRCYTVRPPYAAFQESSLGTIEPGKYADIAILDADVLHVPVEALERIESWLTMVNGQIVWQAR